MFRRRRRRKARAAAAEAPKQITLTGEQVFDLLNARLAQFIGASGDWTLVRRTDDDTDGIFRAMVTHQIAAELTREILATQADAHSTGDAEHAAATSEMALSWTPEPLVVWADPTDAAAADVVADITPVSADELAAADAA
ncbi:hypothetical protein ARHIZOSPH14_27840 [Agromyces rhizosphaerae]|uniref:Uncharacterized protein n=1 Tax=Agromyces rhizosphaerae TaxID=88374 RepID=A0A9W6CXP5_9MICO|nr:hypothetical protein [Agromyces rhizosphaerae]GLI28542.1 hypothetical protein ARHIZOSPH14_27840 [Agromyces rhizosphaerae]